MGDLKQEVQTTIFDDGDEGKPMQRSITASHNCAKCGTGYAGPECKGSPGLFISGVGHLSDAEIAELIGARPNSVVRVGPVSQLEPISKSLSEGVISDLLAHVIGEDVNREGLRETPARVVKAWKAWTAGYAQDPAEVLKVFEDGGEATHGQWIIVKDIPIYSHCEHHLAPFFGTATIGYVSSGRVVGLSKLARLADVYAKRLQVQERLTNQIADALIQVLDAPVAAVALNCRHMCMESRGIQRTGSSTSTFAFKCGPMVTVDGLKEYRIEFFEQLSVL